MLGSINTLTSRAGSTPMSLTSFSSIKSANIPIAFEPATTQAITASGSLPSFANIYFLVSSPIIF